MGKKVHSSFIDNIWSAHLTDIQLISKFKKGFRFLLCAVDIYSKHAWVISLEDKKDTPAANVLQKILNESSRKLNKIWVDKGSPFYKR